MDVIERDRINGIRKDEYHLLCIHYADGEITRRDLDAWLAANPIEWDDECTEPSQPRRAFPSPYRRNEARFCEP